MLAWDQVHARSPMERLREGAEDQESCVAGGQMDTGYKEAVQW
jgi:hypothetical protein